MRFSTAAFTVARTALRLMIVLAAAAAAHADPLVEGRLRLEKLHAFLANNKDVEYRTKVRQFDQASNSTQSLEAHVRARQPNLFNIAVKGPKSSLLFISDGKNITALNTRTKRYSQFLARPTLAWSMNTATTMMAFDARILDFLWSAKYAAAEGGFSVLKKLPATAIGGKTCEGYVVQRDDYQWEIWLDTAGTELPCRLVSIRRDGSALVVQTNDLDWVLTPKFSDDLFNFTPPAGSKQVDTFEVK